MGETYSQTNDGISAALVAAAASVPVNDGMARVYTSDE